MSKDNYYIVNDKKNNVQIIYHQPTGRTASIPLNLDEINYEILDEKLKNVKCIEKPTKVAFGRGKISMTFMSARTCNLGCKYCFAGEGEYGSLEEKPKNFKCEQYLAALLVALDSYPQGVSKIGFFGGEPLLNYQEIEKFIPKCIEISKKKNVDPPQFVITTNAILLNKEMIRFFKKYKVRLSISIDGGKEINDIARNFKKSKASVYEIVKEKCELLKNEKMPFFLQATLNAYHIKNYEKGVAISWIKKLEEFNYCNISVAPVETENDELKISMPEQYKSLDLFMRELTEYYLGKIKKGDINNIASQFVLPILLVAKNKYVRSCPSGHSIFIDTDNKIYPCHMFCNEPSFCIGDTINGIDRNLAEYYANIDREMGDECRTCIAKNQCNFWCKGIQYISNKSMITPCKARCVFQRAVIEECIKTLADLRKNENEGKKFWNNFKLYNKLLLEMGYKEREVV